MGWVLFLILVIFFVVLLILSALHIGWALISWPLFIILAYYVIQYELKKLGYLD